jgi:hypothetical protein
MSATKIAASFRVSVTALSRPIARRSRDLRAATHPRRYKNIVLRIGHGCTPCCTGGRAAAGSAEPGGSGATLAARTNLSTKDGRG